VHCRGIALQSAIDFIRYVRLHFHCCCFLSLVSGRHTQYACLLQIASTQQNKHATHCGHQQTPRQPVVQCQANGATTTSALQMLDAQAPKRRCDNHCTVPSLKTTRAPPTCISMLLQDVVSWHCCLCVKAYGPKCAQDNIAHVVYRRLIIMRHADSIERTDPQTRDHERSITDMGRKAAQQVTLSAVKVIRSLIALQHGVVSCLCMCAMSCQGSSICICNCADMLACGLQAYPL